MYVLYVSFGSKVMSRTFGHVVMGIEVLFILGYRLLLYSAGCRVNREQVVLFRQKLYVGMVVCISWLHLCLCV